MKNIFVKSLLFVGTISLLITGCQSSNSINDDNTQMESAIDNSNYSMIYNNNSDLIQYGNKVYFKAGTEDNLNKPVELGDFRKNDNDATILVGFDNDTHLVENLSETTGYGKLAISKGCLYYEDIVKENSKVLKKLSVIELDAGSKEPKAIEDEILLGGDSQGMYVSTLKKEDDVDYLCVYRGKSQINKKIVYNYQEYIGMDADGVYYVSKNEVGDNVLTQVNLISGEIINLGQFPTDPEGGTEPKIDQFTSDNQNVYIGYGFYDYDGKYVKGYHIKATKNTEDDLAPSIIKTKSGMKETPKFYVKKGKMKKTDGEPYSARVDEAGNIGFYNEKGVFVSVAPNYTSKDIVDAVNVIEEVYYINGRIYFVRDERERVPEAEKGWKEVYKLTSQYIGYVGEENIENDIYILQ